MFPPSLAFIQRMKKLMPHRNRLRLVSSRTKSDRYMIPRSNPHLLQWSLALAWGLNFSFTKFRNNPLTQLLPKLTNCRLEELHRQIITLPYGNTCLTTKAGWQFRLTINIKKRVNNRRRLDCRRYGSTTSQEIQQWLRSEISSLGTISALVSNNRGGTWIQ